jgi:hypothetical protein
MTRIRKLLLVTVGVLALHGVQACSQETELNPQPLPPQGGEPVRAPSGSADDKTSGPEDSTGTGGGSSGTSGTPAPASPDGGTEGGDASDGGPE